LTSLSKLSKIKSTDKSLSVLDCIVDYLDQTCPEVFGVVDDWTCVAEAAKYSLKEQTILARNVRISLGRIRAVPEMNEFHDTAIRKMLRMELDLQKAKDAFAKAKEFFGIAQKDDVDTDAFFGMLSDFFICLDNAVLAREARDRTLGGPSKGNASDGDKRELPKQKKSVASTRLSIFGRLSSSAGSESGRKSLNAPRQSIFGRMRPVKGGGKE
jgi:hypothetical protein